MLEWLRGKSDGGEREREVGLALRRVEQSAAATASSLAALQAEVVALRAEAVESAETLKKLARSFGRTALRVEDTERKIDALGAAPTREPHAVFDALDLLDRALAALDHAAAPELAAGLAGVHARLVDHLTADGFTRIAPLGDKPDGALVRVAGTTIDTTVAAGHVVAVVRAAIKQGERLVREGEVITARAGESA